MTFEVFRVSELLQHLNDLLKRQVYEVTVQGELSGVRFPGSGHAYFRLKDEQGVLDAAMFRQQLILLDFSLKDGIEVTCRGTLSIYPPQGRLQLVVQELDLVGVGALSIAYQKLFSRLTQEGLFHPERKKPLPQFPQKIALITSPTGAALHDLKTVIRRRNPACSLLLATCQVQGTGAAEQIASMLEAVNRRWDVDLIILGRGGGSIEDLWAFNEEVVARAIAASRIPVLTGIGHQTDVTIADFVADKRAATPSVAAEIAVPEIAEWHKAIEHLRVRLVAQIQHIHQTHRLQLKRWQTQLRPPQLALERSRRKLEQRKAALLQTLQRKIQQLRAKRQSLFYRLEQRNPTAILLAYRNRITLALHQLQNHASARLRQQRQRLAQLVQRLQDLSPHHVLQRGYALVYRDNQLVRDIREIQQGELLRIQLAQGTLEVEVRKVTAKTGKI